MTVLIPVASSNTEYLDAALRSTVRAVALASTPCEILLIGDNVPEAQLEALGRIYSTRVGRSERPGISAALNVGLEMSQGEWIIRMDADDLCHPARVRRCLRLAESGEADWYAGALVKFGDLRTRYEAPPLSAAALLERLLHTGHGIGHPATMFRKALALEAGGYESDWDGAEDLDLWLRFLGRGVRFRGSRRVHTFYRVHTRQASRVLEQRDIPGERLARESAALERCRGGCPGRLRSYCGIRSGSYREVCSDFWPHLPVGSLRASVAARDAGVIVPGLRWIESQSVAVGLGRLLRRSSQE